MDWLVREQSLFGDMQIKFTFKFIMKKMNYNKQKHKHVYVHASAQVKIHNFEAAKSCPWAEAICLVESWFVMKKVYEDLILKMKGIFLNHSVSCE